MPNSVAEVSFAEVSFERDEVKESIARERERQPKFDVSPRTIATLMAARRDVRLIGIKRNGDAVRVHIFDGKVDVQSEMTWFEDWNAWSVRPSKGPYQQLCIFERSQP
jgi:hypothetical protein